MNTVLLIRSALTSLVVFYLGARWLAVVPVLSYILLFSYGQSVLSDSFDKLTRDFIQKFLLKNLLWVGWGVLFIGVLVLGDIFLGSLILFSGLVLLVQGFGLCVAYVLGYAAIQRLFLYGMGAIICVLGWQGFVNPLEGISAFGLVVGGVAMVMAFLALIEFPLRSIVGADTRHIRVPLFFALQVVILYAIVTQASYSTSVVLLTAQGFLCLQALLTRNYTGNVLSGRTVYRDISTRQENAFEKILQGATTRDISKDSEESTSLQSVKTFVQRLSGTYLLPVAMVPGLLIAVHAVGIVGDMGSVGGIEMFSLVVFWTHAFIFYHTTAVYARLGFDPAWRRLVVFIVANVTVYATIVSFFGSSVFYLLVFGVLRTLLNTFALIRPDLLPLSNSLERRDIIGRLVGTLLTSLANIFFIVQLPVSAELRVALACLYIGLQLFATYYVMKMLAQDYPEPIHDELSNHLEL